MAVTPQSNEAFLREVDDELRRDQMLTVWERYGRLIIGGIVLALAVFGGFLFWQHQREKSAGIEDETLQAALDSVEAGNAGAAQAPLATLAQSKGDGYRSIARFAQADLLLKKNDAKGAAARFAEIAADQSVAKPFRDLAIVRQTAVEFDTLKPQTVVERLRTLAVKGNPWFGSAGEMTAIAYLAMGRRDLAGTLFGQLASGQDVPGPIRQRAVQMAGVLGVDEVPQNEDSKAQ